MIDDVQIRLADPGDFDALGEVFHDAVRTGAEAYSERQRAAWSPAPRQGPDWHAHLGSQTVWLAEAGGPPLGFITLAPDGHVDLAYIRSDAQRRGLFRRLYAALEHEARRRSLTRLHTEASLHAKGPFLAAGFAVTEAETVERGGEHFTRFRMEKTL
jgi:putative acetyltransferase